MMYRILTLTLALLTSLTALVAMEVGPTIAGYGRDGTRVYPDYKPPTTNLKIAWSTELPSWGHSSPIVVGDKVFLTVEALEGKRLFPALLCLDAKSGKILWDKPLDHMEAVPAGVRGPALQAWTEVMEDFATKRKLYVQFENKKISKDAIIKQGYKPQFHHKKDHFLGVERNDQKQFLKTKLGLAGAGGFSLDGWRHRCYGGPYGNPGTNTVGQAYATPVSDGKHIWAVTAFGGYFCFDLTGKQQWLAWNQHKSKGDDCQKGRSPILWKNLLISDIGNRVRAFDARNGKLLWSHDIGFHTVVSPMVMTVDGKDILWAAGCNAYSLPDGKPLQVTGWNIGGMQTLVKYDEKDVLFFCGAGEHSGWPKKGKNETPPPAAVRFSLEGETLKGTVLWHGGDVGKGRVSGGNKPWMTYYDGGLYHIEGVILDALTGKPKAGAFGDRNRRTPLTSHFFKVANGHVYGWSKSKGGLFGVYTAAGKRVSEIAIGQPKVNYTLGWREGQICGSDAPPFTLGPDAIFARTNVHLHCVR